jgi:hypothetical protein
MPKKELADVEGELRGESESGLAYRFYDGVRTVWLPKSQCEWDPESKTMTLPIWLAEEKELI